MQQIKLIKDEVSDIGTGGALEGAVPVVRVSHVCGRGKRGERVSVNVHELRSREKLEQQRDSCRVHRRFNQQGLAATPAQRDLLRSGRKGSNQQKLRLLQPRLSKRAGSGP